MGCEFFDSNDTQLILGNRETNDKLPFTLIEVPQVARSSSMPETMSGGPSMGNL